MNRTTQFGRFTRDPELRYTPQGKAIVDFTLAVDRIGGNNETDFFDCTAWEKHAELISNSCKKGHRLLIWGRLQQEKWQDQQTGQNRSKIKIIVQGFQFVEPPPGQQQGSTPPQGPPAGSPPGYQQPPQHRGYQQPPGPGQWQGPSPGHQGHPGAQGPPPQGGYPQSSGGYPQGGPPPQQQWGQQPVGSYGAPLSDDDIPF